MDLDAPCATPLRSALSAKRRSPLAGLVVLLLGAAGDRRRVRRVRPRPPPQTSSAPTSHDRRGPGAVPGRLRHLPRHERRGHRTKRRQAVRPVAGRRRRRRRRLPGRHRPDADGPARARRPAQEAASTPRRRSRRSPRTSPRSAPARRSRRRSRLRHRAASTNEQVVRGGEFFRTNCTACHNFAGAGGALPSGKYAPSLKGVSEQAHLRGHAHRPAADAGLLRRGAHARGQARHHRLPQEHRRSRPTTAASRSAALGPVSEGLFAWLVGIGALVGFAVWIASHSARSKKGVKA